MWLLFLKVRCKSSTCSGKKKVSIPAETMLSALLRPHPGHSRPQCEAVNLTQERLDGTVGSAIVHSRSQVPGALQFRGLLSLIFLVMSCGATKDTYILHDDTSRSSSMHRREREAGFDRKHIEHSSVAAVAKVRAQQRWAQKVSFLTL